MDYKTLKQDMTYALKKLQKDGKVLTAHGDNLEIVDKAFVAGDQMDPLEAFVIMKGFPPTIEMLQAVGFNISFLNLLIENTGIIKDDWYAFLDGFDNIISYQKNEFYNVGVYLREKFTPLGVRTIPLEPVVFFEHTLTGELFSKYIINANRGKISIMEVYCEKINSLDPAYSYVLKEDEYKVRILEPRSLYEKKPNGVMVPLIYISHCLFDNLEDAQAKAEKDIRGEFVRNFYKKNVSYAEEDIQAKLLTVQTINL